MSESIIRARKKKKDFSMIQNSVFRDSRLSMESVGLFCTMQSFSENWKYSVTGLARRVRMGRDKLRRCLKELEAAGYLTREQQHQKNGKFGGCVYVLEEESLIPPGPEEEPDLEEAPQEEADPEEVPEEEPSQEEAPSEGAQDHAQSPLTEKPSTAEPSTAFRPQINIKYNKYTKKDPPLPPKGGGGAGCDEIPRPTHDPEAFDIFWAAYPRRDDLAASVKAWDRLKPTRKLCRTMYLALEQHKKSHQWTKESGQYIPTFASWLKGKKWLDEGVDLSMLPQQETNGGWAVDPESEDWWFVP